MKKHTWGVWWTTIFFILQALVYIVAFAILTTVSGITYVLEIFPLADALAGISFLLLLVALVLFLTVKGLLEHKQWAWIVALIFWGYYVIAYLLSHQTGSFIGLVIALIALYGLLNKKTTKAFKFS